MTPTDGLRRDQSTPKLLRFPVYRDRQPLRRKPVVEDAFSVIRRIAGYGSSRSPTMVRVAFRHDDGAVGPRDVATHWIHWYPAKMFHRIPREIFRSLEPPGGTLILDPFCGSGTVLLEALIHGHDALGIDVNPIARLISNVKVNALDPVHLKRHLPGVLRRARLGRDVPEPGNTLAYWFKPDILLVLGRIRRSIEEIDHAYCRDFYLTTFSSIVRSVSWADPSIAPPVKLSPHRTTIANERYKRDLKRARSLSIDDVFDSFSAAAERNIARMKSLREAPHRGRAGILPCTSEAAATGLPNASVDLIVTSPPYCGAQKYVRSLRLEMLLLGMNTDEIAQADRRTLGSERLSIQRHSERLDTECDEANRLVGMINARNSVRALMLAEYVRYMTRFVRECHRVLRPGGNAFVTFGTSRIAGYRVDLSNLFTLAARRVGLHHIATLIDRIPSRGLITQRHESAGRIDDERVVWVKR
jgi:SAM-dependent methyltransferase